jgi:ankyrin repeat protein
VACYKDHLQVVTEFLEHEAAIEAKDNEDSTPLHLSCGEGQLAIFIELLGRGASIDSNNGIR